MDQKKKFRKAFYILAAAIAVIVCAAAFWGVHKGVFSSQQAFVDFVSSTGVFAPLTFVILETLSVVIVILPCSLGYPVAAAAFGTFWGFVLNAISTSAGSIIIFAIVRKWGRPLAEAAVEKKHFDKYEKFMDKTSMFEKIIAAAMLVPFLPDNALCYLAGLTRIKLRRFVIIVILFKPWKILFYTVGARYLINKFSYLWSYAGDIFNATAQMIC